jgi:hypothetical protein
MSAIGRGGRTQIDYIRGRERPNGAHGVCTTRNHHSVPQERRLGLPEA